MLFLKKLLIFSFIVTISSSCLHRQQVNNFSLRQDSGYVPPDTIFLERNYQVTIENNSGDAGTDFLLRPPPDSGALISPITAGQRSPYNGVVFNTQASAFLEASVHGIQQRCLLDRTTDAALLRERARRDIQMVESSLDILHRTTDLEINNRNQEIRSLQENLESATNRASLLPYFTAGGFALGAGLISAVLLLAR